MNKIFVLFLFLNLFLNPSKSISQTIIWSEDFESYSDGTQNSTKWTTTANNCDSDGLPGTSADNYWGTRTTSGDKEFCCEDIEGLTCCGTQGASDNLWLSEDIDISGYSEISISIDMRAEGNMECNACGSGEDLFNAEYQVDGGAWINFLSVCGISDGQSIVECVTVPDGNNLKIRVLLGNQANTEEYYFDDVIVYESVCEVVLPVELYYFDGMYEEETGYNLLEWITASEINNDYFLLEHSTDGLSWNVAKKVYGFGNSVNNIYYKEKHRTTNEIDYYRLTQVDYDGKSETHKTIAINKSTKKPISVKYFNLSGVEVFKDNISGLVIKQSIFENGNIETIKIFYP